MLGTKALSARNSSNITFSENAIKSKIPATAKDLVTLENCQQVNISANEN
jgi:hypothetical protein